MNALILVHAARAVTYQQKHQSCELNVRDVRIYSAKRFQITFIQQLFFVKNQPQASIKTCLHNCGSSIVFIHFHKVFDTILQNTHKNMFRETWLTWLHLLLENGHWKLSLSVVHLSTFWETTTFRLSCSKHPCVLIYVFCWFSYLLLVPTSEIYMEDRNLKSYGILNNGHNNMWFVVNDPVWFSALCCHIWFN